MYVCVCSHAHALVSIKHLKYKILSYKDNS